MCKVILECCPCSFWRRLHWVVASNSGMALPCSASLGDRACTQACSSGGVMLSTDLPSVLAESVQCVSLAACVQIKCILAAAHQWPFELRFFLEMVPRPRSTCGFDDLRGSFQPCVPVTPWGFLYCRTKNVQVQKRIFCNSSWVSWDLCTLIKLC